MPPTEADRAGSRREEYPVVTATVTALGSQPTAHPEDRECGHDRHVGTCPACQRAATRRTQAQLAAAMIARKAWAERAAA